MSSIFPNARYKFFVEAPFKIRLQRMLKIERFKHKSKNQMKELLRRFDRNDINNKLAPLKPSKDSILYNNGTTPDCKQDAVILWYYITHTKEIIDNGVTLKWHMFSGWKEDNPLKW